MHIVLITESMAANSLGRTYCLWLLARDLGWTVTVLTTHGDRMWGPLAESKFAHDVHLVSESSLTEAIPESTELIIAVKPLPRSLGYAARVSKKIGLPLLIDIDDPDLEVRRRAGSPLMAMLRWIRRPLRSASDLRLRRLARAFPSLASNPWLQDRYGGTLIPHTRPSMEPGTVRNSRDLSVAFIGTRHPHKGVDILRAAVAALQDDEHRTILVITDAPPADALPWERWVGRTTLAAGIELARNADAVVLPSLATRHATGQLPVKLIDAMMLGRAIIVSDVEPLPWAVGDTGLVIEPGNATSLTNALRSLRDPAVRADLGNRARKRSGQEFALGVLAPRFERACLDAIMTIEDAPEST